MNEREREREKEREGKGKGKGDTEGIVEKKGEEKGTFFVEERLLTILC